MLYFFDFLYMCVFIYLFWDTIYVQQNAQIFHETQLVLMDAYSKAAVKI